MRKSAVRAMSGWAQMKSKKGDAMVTMCKKIQMRSFVLAFLIVLITSPAAVSATQVLDRRVENVKLSGKDIHYLLSKFAYTFDVPIGLEADYRSSKSDSIIISVDIEASTVRDVIDRIVQQDRRYEWSFENGVIHVFPRGERDGILRTAIHHISL